MTPGAEDAEINGDCSALREPKGEALSLGLEMIQSVNKHLLSTYCVPGHLIYMVSFHCYNSPCGRYQ